MKCLLIKTKDNRKFFVHKKHLMQLVEFSRTFNASLSIIKINKGTILELEELASAICDPTYKSPVIQYEIIKNSNANKTKKYILEQFKSNKIVSLKELKNKFNLSSATLCNYVRKIKNELEKSGYKIQKLGAGKYRCMI